MGSPAKRLPRFVMPKTLEEVKPEIAELAKQYPEVQAFSDFFERSTRGLIR